MTDLRAGSALGLCFGPATKAVEPGPTGLGKRPHRDVTLCQVPVTSQGSPAPKSTPSPQDLGSTKSEGGGEGEAQGVVCRLGGDSPGSGSLPSAFQTVTRLGSTDHLSEILNSVFYMQGGGGGLSQQPAAQAGPSQATRAQERGEQAEGSADRV